MHYIETCYMQSTHKDLQRLFLFFESLHAGTPLAKPVGRMEAFKNGPFDLIYNRKVAQQTTNHRPGNPRQQWLVKRCNLKLPVRTGDAHVTTQNSFVEAVNSAGAQAAHCSKHVYDFDTKTIHNDR